LVTSISLPSYSRTLPGRIVMALTFMADLLRINAFRAPLTRAGAARQGGAMGADPSSKSRQGQCRVGGMTATLRRVPRPAIEAA
jgi:hypothetical protein